MRLKLFTLLVGLATTLVTAVIALPMLIPCYLAITKQDSAYLLLGVPGLLAFSYLNGMAVVEDLVKKDTQDR